MLGNRIVVFFPAVQSPIAKETYCVIMASGRRFIVETGFSELRIVSRGSEAILEALVHLSGRWAMMRPMDGLCSFCV